MGCHGHFDTFEVTWETVCKQKSRGPNVKLKYTHLRNKVMNEYSKGRERKKAVVTEVGQDQHKVQGHGNQENNISKKRGWSALRVTGKYRRRRTKSFEEALDPSPIIVLLLFVCFVSYSFLLKGGKSLLPSKENRDWIKDHLQVIFVFGINPTLSKKFLVSHYALQQN